MKRITLLVALVALVLSSCKDKNAYTINGNFNDTSYDGKMVYMQKIADLSSPDSKPEVLDSAVVKDGKFKLEGIAPEKPEMRFVSLGKLTEMEKMDPEKPTLATIVLQPGDIDVTVNGSMLSVKGTALNEDFNKIQELSNQRAKIFKDVQAGTLDEATATEQLTKLMKDVQEMSYTFTKANMANPIGEFMFISSSGSFDKEKLKELIALSTEDFRKKPEISNLLLSIEAQEKLETSIMNGSLKLTNQAGQVVSLSDYAGKGKVVLLDFWASWCAPCIKQIPELKSIYAKYNTKGFEIVSISIDEEKGNWTKSLAANKMDWVQLLDADGSVAGQFGVENIPFTVLLDKDGKIFAAELNAPTIERALADLLK